VGLQNVYTMSIHCYLGISMGFLAPRPPPSLRTVQRLIAGHCHFFKKAFSALRRVTSRDKDWFRRASPASFALETARVRPSTRTFPFRYSFHEGVDIPYLRSGCPEKRVRFNVGWSE
jgi:hypothetical protein